MDSITFLLAGASVILLLILIVILVRAQSSESIIRDSVKNELQTLTQSSLSHSSEQLLTLANERLGRVTEQNQADLESKKQLIDERLTILDQQLTGIGKVITQYEKDRAAKFGQLSNQLEAMGIQTQSLTAATTTLREALSNSQTRGQWGERMAEDVLRLLGFIEGVNYEKQQQIEGGTQRPDYKFMLPNDFTLNMDVKFPLDNYLKYLEEEMESGRTRFIDSFLRDVKGHINAVANKEYIDPEGGTLDYVLLFIPNENIYSFIHENDSTIMDHALGKQVIFCSPLTLYAILSVIRQAVDSFALRREEDDIIALMGRFYSEWQKFGESLETVGRRIRSAESAYEDLKGPRKRMLERSLARINALQQQRAIASADEGDDVDSSAKISGQELAEDDVDSST